jgi:hypothetical protein
MLEVIHTTTLLVDNRVLIGGKEAENSIAVTAVTTQVLFRRGSCLHLSFSTTCSLKTSSPLLATRLPNTLTSTILAACCPCNQLRLCDVHPSPSVSFGNLLFRSFPMLFCPRCFFPSSLRSHRLSLPTIVPSPPLPHTSEPIIPRPSQVLQHETRYRSCPLTRTRTSDSSLRSGGLLRPWKTEPLLPTRGPRGLTHPIRPGRCGFGRTSKLLPRLEGEVRGTGRGCDRSFRVDVLTWLSQSSHPSIVVLDQTSLFTPRIYHDVSLFDDLMTDCP